MIRSLNKLSPDTYTVKHGHKVSFLPPDFTHQGKELIFKGRLREMLRAVQAEKRQVVHYTAMPTLHDLSQHSFKALLGNLLFILKRSTSAFSYPHSLVY